MSDRKVKVLRRLGFLVGERDPRRNTAFRGAFMVAEPIDEDELPTESAARGGWCVVGDNLAGLVEDTCSAFEIS